MGIEIVQVENPGIWLHPAVFDASNPYRKGEMIQLKSGELATVFEPLNGLPDLGITFDGEPQVWLCLKDEVERRSYAK